MLQSTRFAAPPSIAEPPTPRNSRIRCTQSIVQLATLRDFGLLDRGGKAGQKRYGMAWFLLRATLKSQPEVKVQPGGGDARMKPIHAQSDLVFHTELMQVGQEVFPVYGDENSGFSVDPGDFAAKLPPPFRYQSRDELFFALVNFNLGKEGSA